MKKYLLSTAAVLALVTTASAADLPRKSVAPAFAAVPVFSWTGFYLGVNGGYSATQFDRTATVNRAFIGPALANATETLGARSIKANGFIGGLQGGYNYQISSFVVGLEGDFNFVDAKKSLSPEAFSPGNVILSSSSKVEWLATVRGRLGLAFDRFLVYGTGGVAFASVKVTDQVDFRPNGAPGLGLPGSSSNTRTGYALGAGMEYAFTNNWTVKAEYLYVDLGKTNYTHGIVPGFPLSGVELSNKTKLNIARIGINYKF
jgi:outer membrane immunogenic protein